MAEDIDASESEILFTRHIAPMMRESCLACHGQDPDKIKGKLDMRSLKGLAAGGVSGEASVVPGKPEQSPLYLAATRKSDDWSAMPPKESQQLSDKQLAQLRAWIISGAAWPDAERRLAIEKHYAEQWSIEDGIQVKTSGGLDDQWTSRRYDPAGLWAYQPLQQVTIKSNRNPIDVLIEARLPDGLSVAPRADRRTLLRRVTYDLTGLPPTPKQMADFLSDERTDREVFESVVDRLLQSPHYGERMAQHWLDVTRYADSSGFSNDYERGNAWRYRDYVARSFNNDKPYDEFVREQIAGDEIKPDDAEAIIATGFLRMGPWELTGMEVPKIARQRFLDDVTNSVGETFLAHSLQCARCHDHKFDPVPTQDYYAIQAVFATTQLAERKADFLKEENTSGFDEQSYLIKTRQTHQKTLADLDRVQLANAQMWFRENGKSSKKWDEVVSNLDTKGNANNVFNAARGAMARAGVDQSDYPPKLVGFTPEEYGAERVARKGLQRLAWEFDRYEPYALSVYSGRTRQVKNVSAPTRLPANRMKVGELEKTAILTGGNPFSQSHPVSPSILSVVADQAGAAIPNTIGGRRHAFAHWVSDAKNPLTARVMVNRIWLWHFGDAIAGNPNNFGATGKPPTHPQLLDHLAGQFIRDGWSVKSVHRLILNSDAYCRSAKHPDPVSIKSLDPEGSYYAVFKPRRLTAEELRDSMLLISGELNPQIGGIPCRPEINPEVALQPRQVMGTIAAAWTPNPKPEQRHRRSLYVLKLRGLINPMFEVFNSPSPDFSCERRTASTITPQVFSLFNGQDAHSRALAMAARVLREADSDEDAIRRCFQLTLTRDPSKAEMQEFLHHWQQTQAALPDQAPDYIPPPTEITRLDVDEFTGENITFTEKLHSNKDFVPDLQPADVDKKARALSDICHLLFNTNEFIYVY
ncbi:MAG: PSD1 and planctomycete cytochrome C domain-containing protein [Pseudomonadota bacterium]